MVHDERSTVLHPQADTAQLLEQEKPPRVTRWRELDLLRGWAAALMVTNHMAVSTPAIESSRLVAMLGFLGSMAPVMFFTLTGLGYGVQEPRSGPRSWRLFLPKILILLIADAFLWMSPDTWIGNNFLGFIALSMLVLELLRGSRRGGQVAAALCLGIIALRFVVAPGLRARLQAGPGNHWIGFLLGIDGLSDFSYPPEPWLAYPLLGYCLGRIASARRADWGERPLMVAIGMLLVTAVLGGMSFVILARGGVLFRYGLMSAGFFMISLAFLSASLAAAFFLCKIPSLSGAVGTASLSGIRSLSIVPLHYLYRDLLSLWMPKVTSAGSYLASDLVGIIACFAASGLVPRAGRRLLTLQYPLAGRMALWAVVLLCGGSVLLGNPADLPQWVAPWTGQLLLCVLLAASMSSHRPVLRDGDGSQSETTSRLQ